MEDISKQQIARLVLGYLKNEKYHLAYNYFYKQCAHFDKYRQKRMKISTRYNGLSLDDVLQQYSEIYCIVQPRLEETDYFEKETFEPHKLSKQLLYLLDDDCCKRARSLTPRTCSSPLELECNISMDLSTTPLNNLPGNIEESFTDKSIKKTNNLQLIKKHVSIGDPETERDESSSGEAEETIVEEYVEVIRESILASEELQEKIAHTINEVQNSNATTEFDTVVQAILNRTESDPVFENMVEEILGTAPDLGEKENLNKTTSKGPRTVSTSIKSAHSFQPNFTSEDSNPQSPSTKEEPVMVEQAVQVPEKKLKTILPVRKSKEQENIRKFITLYKSDVNDEESSSNTDVDSPADALNAPVSITESSLVPSSQTSHPSLSLEKSEPREAAQSGNREIIIPTDNKTPELCLSSKKAPTPSQRSGSRSSHVRALDFKFQTPAKESVKMTPSSSQSPKIYSSRNKSSNCQKSSKSLFEAENVWTSVKNDPQLNENANQAVGKKSEIPSPNENIDSSNQSDKKPKLPPKLAAKKAVAQLTKNKNAKKKTSTSPCAVNAEKANETTPIANKKSRSKVISISRSGENDSNAVELINANKPAVFKKKCNIDSKKDAQLKVFRDLKDAEVIAEGDKLVLSPSNLNGNKRSLVGTDAPIKVQQLITPDATKIEPAVVPSASTIRNILPFLETPAKDVCPKTPGTYDSATAVDTPFTKVFNEHMSGVDLSSILTPKIMCTPSFPFTPLLEATETPSSNRPTDYSTSSSYYQPSDTEQCKSIETLIQECERLESNNKEEKIDTVAEPKSREVANAKIAEKMKSLANNVIARKNLNLMQSDKDAKSRESNTSDSSSSSSDSDSSGSSVSSFSPTDDDNQNTVLENSENSRYSLRARSVNTSGNKTESLATKTPTKVSSKSKESKAITDTKDPKPTSGETSRNNQKNVKEIVNTVEYVPHLINDTLKSGQKTKLLSDLDEIKMRVLQGIKNEDCGKRKKAALPTPTKKKTNPPARVLRSNVIVSNEINLSSSSSDEEIADKVQPFEVVEAELSDSNTPLSQLKEEGPQKFIAGTINASKISIKEGSTTDRCNDREGISKVNANKEDQKKSKKTVEKSTRRGIEKQPNKVTKKSHQRQATSDRQEKKSASKVPNEPPKPRKVNSEISSKKKNDTALKTKDRTNFKDTFVELPKKIDAPISILCEKLSPEQESNANDALSWFLGRGINLMQNPNKVTKVTSVPSKKGKDKGNLKPLEPVKYNKVVDYLKTENISHCLVNMYTNEDDLIYFDTKVYSEPFLSIDRSDGQCSTKKYDSNGDNERLTKAYEVKVYDDVADEEITKLFHVSPFESLFDCRFEPVENVCEQSKVKVLDNVVVKRTPLDILYRSLVSPVKRTNVDDDERLSSPLDNLYPTNASTRSRFSKKSNNETATTKTILNDNRDYPNTTKRAVNEEASFKINVDRARKTEKSDKDKKRKVDIVDADEETDCNKKFKFDDLKLLKEAQVEHVLEQMYNS